MSGLFYFIEALFIKLVGELEEDILEKGGARTGKSIENDLRLA